MIKRQWNALERWTSIVLGPSPPKEIKAAVTVAMLSNFKQAQYRKILKSVLVDRQKISTSEDGWKDFQLAAAARVAFVLLARVGELLPPRSEFNPALSPTTADVSWFNAARPTLREVSHCSAEERRRMPHIAFRFRFKKLKNDQFLRVWNQNCPAIVITDSPICPVQALLANEIVRGRSETEPLFTISADLLRRAMHDSMQSLAPHGTRITGHSLRVGGATALLAAGAPTAVLQQWGRWSSTSMPALYARVNTAAAQEAMHKVITGSSGFVGCARAQRMCAGE